MTIIEFIKKEKVNVAMGGVFCLLLALSACNNGNKNDDQQAYEEARASYSACVTNRGQDLCDRIKSSQGVMSINEYLGKNSYSAYNGLGAGYNPYSTGYVNPYANGYNNPYNNYAANRAYVPGSGVYNNTQASAQMVERGYFDSYFKNLPEEAIREMNRRWRDFAAGVDNEYNALRGGCTWSPCY